MVRASEVEGTTIGAPDGTVAGTLEKLLLHPDGSAVVVGAAVRPPAALVVVGRSQTYIPLAALEFNEDGVATSLAKLPKVRESAEPFGMSPEMTVIWSGMPIVGPAGTEAGFVRDFEFDAATGVLSGLTADGGAVANAAYGMLEVPAESIQGYSAGAIHLTKGPAELQASGGVAKAAAAAVVGAAESVAAVGDLAGAAAVSAGAAAGRAVKAVKDGQFVERAAHRAGKTWYDSIKAFKDGMNSDD